MVAKWLIFLLEVSHDLWVCNHLKTFRDICHPVQKLRFSQKTSFKSCDIALILVSKKTHWSFMGNKPSTKHRSSNRDGNNKNGNRKNRNSNVDQSKIKKQKNTSQLLKDPNGATVTPIPTTCGTQSMSVVATGQITAAAMTSTTTDLRNMNNIEESSPLCFDWNARQVQLLCFGFIRTHLVDHNIQINDIAKIVHKIVLSPRLALV